MAWHPDDFPLLDDFNRADQTPPGGDWDPDIGIWGYEQGMRVIDNQLGAVDWGYLDGVLQTTYAKTQPVAWGGTIAASPGTSVIFLWMAQTLGDGGSNDPTGLYIRYESGSMQLLQDPGSQIGPTVSVTWGVGDKICMGIEGTTASMWHKPAAGAWSKVAEGTADVSHVGPFHLGVEWNSLPFRLDDVFGGHMATPLNEITDADFESFAVGTNPSGVAPSGTTWHRTNANRTVVVDNNRNPRRGTRSCWIERQVGDVTASGNRTEFYDGRSVLENSSTGHDAYYATSIYLPDGTESHLGRSDPAWDPEDNFALVWQIHQQDDIPGSPPIALHADRYWSAGNDVSLYLHIRGGDPESPSTQDLFFTWDEEIRGQWLDLIWRVKFATDSTGLVQGWIRREAEDNFTAVHDGQPGYIYGTWTNIPTAFTGDTASYRKGGIYLGVNKRQTIYHHGYGRFLTYEAAEAWFSSPTVTLRTRGLLGVGS